ncbi:MAG: threonine synthase [Desulfobulbia bacterium]
MQYLSTRGNSAAHSFTEAVMTGLAEDGGLLLPRAIPRLNRATFESWQQLSYSELAYEVMSRFIDDIPTADLKALINKSYGTFTDEQIVPHVHLDDLHILELFHGPTLAFKDIALQFLGNLFEYLLARDDGFLNILGATSGDTGSAAIHGVKGRERIRIFILHPHQRISEVQEKQMTTVADGNVFNLAVEGTFDDAQAAVKSIFSDIEFKNSYHLGAINSINWARILAQVVYYIYSCLHVAGHEKHSAVSFSVPTGNFGDIFAGFIAKKMLPEGCISKLVLATNSNDILSRFVNEGDYSLGDVVATSSPSMDIQAASNFERYLYYLMDSEPDLVREAMLKFSVDGKLYMQNYLAHIKRDFSASSISEDEVQKTIARYYQDYHYILDPHTAVGVRAAEQHRDQGVPMVCLATAHPAKFGATVEQAIGRQPDLPPSLAELEGKPSRCEVMDCSIDALMAYIERHALSRP